MPVNSASPHKGKGWRFWAIFAAIFAALSITSVLPILASSVISTAMPVIILDLGSGPASVCWVVNAYFLTMAAFQPLYGQAANIFGRRSPAIVAVVLFAVGSAIAGGARDIHRLIAGRAVQGLGGGGMTVMVDLIVCDLVPLRERPRFMGFILSISAIATSLGPVVGGVMAQRATWTWRWIFYMNLPIAGVALVILIMAPKANDKRDSMKKLIRLVDFRSNALLVIYAIAVLLALLWGDTERPWSSWQTIVPLVLGFVGLVNFLVSQSSAVIPEPTMRPRPFSNRKSLATLGLSVINSILSFWVAYFLAVYFQSVLEASPAASGIDLLPSAITAIPFAIFASAGLSAAPGRYRHSHLLGVIMLTITFGLLSRLNRFSSTEYWVGTQILGAVGSGVLMTTTLPAINASMAESDVAIATATWGFLCSFGGIWGVAIPTAVFNSNINRLLGRVNDAGLRGKLANGGAYALASKEFMTSLRSSTALETQVLGIYVESLKLVWLVGLGLSLLAFVIVRAVKEVPMLEQLETEPGTVEDKSGFTETIIDVEQGLGTRKPLNYMVQYWTQIKRSGSI